MSEDFNMNWTEKTKVLENKYWDFVRNNTWKLFRIYVYLRKMPILVLAMGALWYIFFAIRTNIFGNAGMASAATEYATISAVLLSLWISLRNEEKKELDDVSRLINLVQGIAVEFDFNARILNDAAKEQIAVFSRIQKDVCDKGACEDMKEKGCCPIENLPFCKAPRLTTPFTDSKMGEIDKLDKRAFEAVIKVRYEIAKYNALFASDPSQNTISLTHMIDIANKIISQCSAMLKAYDIKSVLMEEINKCEQETKGLSA